MSPAAYALVEDNFRPTGESARERVPEQTELGKSGLQTVGGNSGKKSTLLSKPAGDEPGGFRSC